MKQVIRIIGGKYRGKKIQFPALHDLRPTPARVRETLFNWLMHDIKGASCLDAYAGSGALGFEAYSRGASRIVFVEKNREAFINLQKQAAYFHSPNISVKNKDFYEFAKQCHNKFDIIFMDPPFAENFLIEDNIITIEQCIKDNGLLYVESAREITFDDKAWQKVKLKRAGEVVYGLYKRLTSGHAPVSINSTSTDL